MTQPVEDKKFLQVVQKIEPQSKLLRTWKLTGGVSAQITALEVEQPDGQTKKMIVRQYGDIDLKHNSQIAANEFQLLQQLHSVGLAVPIPYYLDQCGEIFSTPYIVIEYIEGKAEFVSSAGNDLIPQFAMHLSKIHQIDCSRLDVSFLPQQEQRYAEKLRGRLTRGDESAEERHIWDALTVVWPLPQHNPSVLLHGDFWPGNILWKDEQLVAIIDWEDAAIGDPLADLANSRLEILWAFGIEAMQRFTQQYQAITTIDVTNLPYWDIYAALRLARFAEWTEDNSIEKHIRERYQWFLTQAHKSFSGRNE